MSDIKIIDNFLETGDVDKALKIIKNLSWVLNHASIPVEKCEGPQSCFAFSDLSKNEFFTDDVFDKIQKKMDKKYELLRVYVNGHTQFLNGTYHQDDFLPNTYTCILYMNEEVNEENWEEYGGCTEFNFSKFSVERVKPIFNRAIIFDSTIVHRGLAPEVPGFLRKTVAFKMKEII
jgi:hypothetical protein